MAAETVLVTGASSGIGLELAKLFAAEGSNLVLVARREDALQQLATQLRGEHGVNVHVVPQDLAISTSSQQIYEHLKRHGIILDVLVNNAGFGDVGLVSRLPLESQIHAIQVNVTALTALTRLFLPEMLDRRRGGVLNLSSTAAFQPGPGMAVYFATKAYVLSFTEALVEELVGTGVTATCLAPGVTHTPFLPRSGVSRARLGRLGALDVQYVARAGYRGFRAGRALVVPGVGNKLLTFAVRFTPRWLVRKIVRQLTMPPQRAPA